jgi:predicted ATPase with chaperone activity
MPSQSLEKLLQAQTTPEELDIPVSIVSDLALRLLFNEGEVGFTRFVDVIRVHKQILDNVLNWMKGERMVEVARAGSFGTMSYTYRLTDGGMERAKNAMERSQYVGPAPVPIEKYNQAILLQTKGGGRTVRPQQLTRALGHLVLPPNFDRRIGPAVNSGTSLFLYGPPGNGKTTIAQTIGMLLSGAEGIRIPYAITVGGQLIKVFDPLVHVPIKDEATQSTSGLAQIDPRWGLFRRPVVMVGGELKMESLDLRFEPISKFYEAPLQLKANGGMFLIDDFGRQQVSPQDLLNRWIVPLESNIDFFKLQSGQSFEVPFRQLIVFSTNLDPGDLVDDAFLRRIQMKVEVGSPDEKMFYQIFVMMAKSLKVKFDQKSFVHLVNNWYRKPGRTLQSVHPRDILKTVISICNYAGVPPQLTPELIDEACESYFVTVT